MRILPAGARRVATFVFVTSSLPSLHCRQYVPTLRSLYEERAHDHEERESSSSSVAVTTEAPRSKQEGQVRRDRAS